MRASFDAAGEVVVVTGGANGIGAAVAAAIARAGGRVAVFDVDTATPPSEPGVELMRVDVGDRAAVAAAVAEVEERLGPVTGLVAGAAVQPRVTVADMTPDTWRRTLGVNLEGVLWACQAVLPGMRERDNGAIVVYTSGLATAGRAEASAYAASKAALVPFAKSLAAELAGTRVRVNVIAPGVIDTPQFQAANPSGGEREHWAATTGIGGPEDVVGPLLFLLSDAATMTGSTLTRERAYPARRAQR